MKLENIKVYDLNESLIASGYPMRTELETNAKPTEKDIKRCLNLTKASSGNGAHGQWMTGVKVSFDLTCSNKMWVEAERYRFLEFVSSQSTMHRISKFKIGDQCNEYVDPRVIDVCEGLSKQYNDICDQIANSNEKDSEDLAKRKKKAYLRLLYSIPAGFELTARMTTNYRCLLNIYIQRHDHRLPEWREFCEKLLELPLFKQLVEAYQGESNDSKK